MPQDRKRGRNQQEDEVEFMPLSKRINNLHINNRTLLMENRQMTNMNNINTEWVQNNINQLPESPPASVQSLDWNAPQYNPEMTENENPHYFNINKLLFEMYVERLQRGGN